MEAYDSLMLMTPGKDNSGNPENLKKHSNSNWLQRTEGTLLSLPLAGLAIGFLQK